MTFPAPVVTPENTASHERRACPTRAIAVIVVVLATLLPMQTAGASQADENAFVAGVNQARANAGLPALQIDGQLTSLARGWAERMRDGACGQGNHICHASPISAGVTHNWAKLGENVGTGGDVDSVMSAFIASAGHYANIVDPEFTHIGVGVVWQDGRLYTTHRFMSLQGGAPPAPAPTTTSTTTAPPSTTAAPAPKPAPVPVQPTTTTEAPVVPESPTPTPPPVATDRAQVVVRALIRLT